MCLQHYKELSHKCQPAFHVEYVCMVSNTCSKLITKPGHSYMNISHIQHGCTQWAPSKYIPPINRITAHVNILDPKHYTAGRVSLQLFRLCSECALQARNHIDFYSLQHTVPDLNDRKLLLKNLTLTNKIDM